MGCGSSQPAVEDNNASTQHNHTADNSGAAKHEEQKEQTLASATATTATVINPIIVVAPQQSPNATSQPADSLSAASADSQPQRPLTPSKEVSQMSAASIAHYTQVLSTVPLLAKLTHTERQQLTTVLTPKRYRPSEDIIVEGEIGYGFFIIAKGDVVVYKNNERREKVKIAALKEGDFFGETALINNAKRGASVSAGQSGVEVLYLEKKNFDSLFGPDRLNIQFAKRQAVSAEKQSTVAGGAPAGHSGRSDGLTEKSVESIKLIHSTISGNILFLNLEPELLSQIISQMYRREIPAGTNAIVQGDHGDDLYVVESGRFEIFVNKKKVAEREKGSLFGELALMYNSPRAATVTAVAASVVWVLDRFTFRRIVTNNNEKKFELYLKFLKKVDLLTPLAEYERRKVAEALDEVMYSPGSTIFKQGDDGDAMYIVYGGEVKICKKEDGEDEMKEVMRCVSGEYFGERALLLANKRAASAIAVTNVQLLRLDKFAFTSLLGPLEDIMKKKVESYNEPPSTSRKGELAAATAAAAARPALPAIPFSDLVVLGTLGKGSFGYVQLVQSKTTKQTFALKAVSKTQIVKTGQQGHVMSEKRAMSLFDHPFCIKLFGTYKDKDRLYFLLEPSLGGELFSVLRERTLFDEDTARFYAGSVVLAFEYIHNLNYCYRDLKPENLLLDATGYLKVTDFGFAKEISSGRTWTLCGTPDYLAPEIVAGKGHGKAVDWWTVGVFIYEMLASYPPFYDEDPMRTYAKIMRGTVSYPSHFSKHAVSLIAGLLQSKPTRRLGALKGGVAEIKQHAWFDGFDWDKLIKQKLPAPILPKIKNEHDLSNFDDYSKQPAPQIQPYVDDGTHWDADF